MSSDHRRFGLNLLPIHVENAKVHDLLGRGRFAVVSILLLPVFLITSCGSTTHTSAGLVLPVSCSSAIDCLNTARMDGFREHVLTPAGDAVSAGKSWYFPPQGRSGWGFELSYRDVKANQNFEETIGTRPIVYPCQVQAPDTQVETSGNGRQICFNTSRTMESARFYSSGVLYQLHLSGNTNSDAFAQKALLLRIVDQLS